ncbi:hypothetical protein BJX96DRAFT_155793 [Aspergillus floccosus]
MMVQEVSIHRRRSRRFPPDCPLPVPSGSSPTTTTTTPRGRRHLDAQEPLPSDTDSIRCHSGDSDILARRAMPSSVPSLSSDAASVASSTSSLSLDTGWASGLANHILEDDGTGALVVPPTALPPPAPSPPPRPLSISSSPAAIATQSHPPPHHPRRYICLFPVLDCHDTFDDAEQWKTHVLSHFRTHDPPDTARCPLCPDMCFEDSPDAGRGRAWDCMLDHVDAAHYRFGQSLAGCRPDFALMQYLFRLRIISVDQFKGMQMAPPPSSPAYHRSQEPLRRNIGSSDEPYCAPYSRRREERMRGQRRGVSVV